jgi:hypothetical protein
MFFPADISDRFVKIVKSGNLRRTEHVAQMVERINACSM